MPSPDIYGRQFFRRRAKTHHDRQVLLAGQFYRLFKPESVFDAGCGIGSYLVGFKACGVEDAGGLDFYGFAYAIKGLPILPVDLSEPLKFEPSGFDLCLCIEVAEHIDKRKSHILASNLARLTKGVLIFTAAGPGQRGRGHVNCRPQPAWLRTMRRAGLRYSGRLTNKVIAAMQEVNDPESLAKNTMVFVKPAPQPEAPADV